MLLPALLVAALLLPKQVPAGFHSVEVAKGMSVLLPTDAIQLDVDPSELKKSPDDGKGNVWAFVTDRCAYTVGTDTFDARTLEKVRPDEILANSVRGTLHGQGQPTLKKQRDILLNGWPGIDMVCAGRDIAGICRTFVVGQTMYQLLVTYPVAKGRPEGVETFLGSLTLSPPPPAGPLKKPGPTFEIFSPPGADFSIGMPGKPELWTEGQDPKKPGFQRFKAEYGNRIYTVGSADLPAELLNLATEDEIRTKVMDQVTKSFEGTSLKPSSGVIRDGITFEREQFSFPEGGWGQADVAVVGKRAYTVVMIYPPGHVGSPDIDEFFNSFKLIPPKTESK